MRKPKANVSFILFAFNFNRAWNGFRSAVSFSKEFGTKMRAQNPHCKVNNEKKSSNKANKKAVATVIFIFFSYMHTPRRMRSLK